jgi:hypothetical protein
LFASLVLLTAASKKKRKKKPWKPGASSGHITNLKESIFCLSISMGMNLKHTQSCGTGVYRNSHD